MCGTHILRRLLTMQRPTCIEASLAVTPTELDVAQARLDAKLAKLEETQAFLEGLRGSDSDAREAFVRPKWQKCLNC